MVSDIGTKSHCRQCYRNAHASIVMLTYNREYVGTATAESSDCRTRNYARLESKILLALASLFQVVFSKDVYFPFNGLMLV